jgi:hypothetical protein
MRYAVWMIGVMLLSQAAMRATAADAADGCTMLAKRLQRQDRIGSVFRCNRLRPAGELNREQSASKPCARKKRVRLGRLVDRRALILEQCLYSRLHKWGGPVSTNEVPTNEPSDVRRRQAGDRRGAAQARKPSANAQAGSARSATAPGTDERNAAAELIRKLLAQGSAGILLDGGGSKPEKRQQTFRTGLTWSYAGPIESMHCVQWREPSDPHNWDDNYLCADKNVGFQWSFRGPILGRGLKCIQVNEKSDPHDWHDNYFCWPRDLNVTFRFSSTGRVYGFSCLAIIEPSDPNTWRDNYLCHRPGQR